jgi:hypothetical protein
VAPLLGGALVSILPLRVIFALAAGMILLGLWLMLQVQQQAKKRQAVRVGGN